MHQMTQRDPDRSPPPEGMRMETQSDRTPTAAPLGARRASVERLQGAADAVLQALRAPAVSLDLLRRAVVRYGGLARDQALQLEEMLTTLTRSIREAIDDLPDTRRTEVLAFVQWWAVHGYHRAD
jgi:hypothetical protein